MSPFGWLMRTLVVYPSLNPDVSNLKMKTKRREQNLSNDKFSTYSYDACCSAAGLGGCIPTGVVKYVPDWNTSSCLAKSETSLTDSESTVESDSASECCSEFFGFRRKQCCKDSGGCD